VFATPGKARLAIEELRDTGFASSDVGVLTRDDAGDPDIKSIKELSGSMVGTGAVVGAAAGTAGGAIWAICIAIGVLPAIGTIIAGGGVAAVAASAATGAATGVLVGALTGLGIDDEEAAYYDEEFRNGRTIVLVDAGSRSAEAKKTMSRFESSNRYERDDE